MLDYSKYKTTNANPDAASMIETFRTAGYIVGSAIADIIDNPISAKASFNILYLAKSDRELARINIIEGVQP
tara:strand:+ start:166 stop:381 length:216 start_codon:yes stop_codon:yes gene_type:complete